MNKALSIFALQNIVLMKQIPIYRFYRRKYGTELLIDVLDLDYVKTGIRKHPVHRETFYCLIAITDGCEKVVLNGYEREVKEREIICSRPGEVWEWMPDPQLKGLVLIFEEQFLLSFFNDPKFLHRFHYLNPDRTSPFLRPDNDLFQRVLHLYEEMKEEIDDKRYEKDQHLLRAMLYETLMLLNRVEKTPPQDTTQNDVTADRYADAFVKLAEQEFTVQRNVEYYADKLCITPNYLNKIIRQHFGVTTKQYLAEKTLGEAERLLTYTSLTVNEIAGYLNFETVSYFVRFFRKTTGKTPSQFRKDTDSWQ